MPALLSRSRPLLGLLTALALLLGGALTIAPAAHAVGSATISGSVVDTVGDAIEGVSASYYIYDDAESEWSYQGAFQTDEDGLYEINGLAYGGYRVTFDSPGYLSQAWPGAATVEGGLTIVLNASNQNQVLTQAVLSRGAIISGTVTKTGGGAVEDVQVVAAKYVGGVRSYDGDGYGYTEADGSYEISALTAGTYTLILEGGDPVEYPKQYLGTTVVEGDATTFTLASTQNKPGVNAVVSLTPAGSGSIAGTVTKPGGGALPDASVQAYRQVDGSWEWIAQATTNGSGAYILRGLLAGQYRVGFSADGYAPEYWNDVKSVLIGTTVPVAAGGAVTGISASLVTGSQISGTVSIVGGGNPTDIHLHAIRLQDGVPEQVDSVSVEPDGTYTLGSLPGGSYVLELHGGDADIPLQYAGGVADLAGVVPFTLGDSATKTGVNATVVRGASIAGTVRNPSGANVADVTVEIYRRVTSGATTTWDYVESSSTNGFGAYDYASLFPGTYTLRFVGGGAAYPTQYLGGTELPAKAETFTVTSGQVKSALDYTLRVGNDLDRTGSTTTLALSTGSRPFGTESTATVKVTSPSTIGAATVTLKEGGTTVATAALVGGNATLTLPKTLAVGSHSLVAVYAGAGKVVGSTSSAATLTVVKAKSTVTAKLAKKSIKKKAKGKVAVTVTAVGLVPTGSVVVKDGKKTLKTSGLTNGKVTVTLPKLKKGKHKITVTYKGSDTVNGATSSSSTLKVT